MRKVVRLAFALVTCLAAAMAVAFIMGMPQGYVCSKNGVVNVVFSPDGQVILVNRTPGQAELWSVGDLYAPRIFPFPGHNHGVWDVIFSPDGKTILTLAGDTTARLWNIETGKTLSIFSMPNYGTDKIEFSLDGRAFISATPYRDPLLTDTDEES